MENQNIFHLIQGLQGTQNELEASQVYCLQTGTRTKWQNKNIKQVMIINQMHQLKVVKIISLPRKELQPTHRRSMAGRQMKILIKVEVSSVYNLSAPGPSSLS